MHRVDNLNLVIPFFHDINAMLKQEARIEMNKERLRQDSENLGKIQNLYGVFVVFLSFIGIYSLDFVKTLKTIAEFKASGGLISFLIFFILSAVLVLFAVCYFIALLWPKEVAHEPEPKLIYRDLADEVSKWMEEQDGDYDLQSEINDSYIEMLEDAVSHNYALYQEKRKYFYNVVVFSFISLIPFVISIIIQQIVLQ